MSTAAKAVAKGKAQKAAVGKAKPSNQPKVVHNLFMKTYIPAGIASAAPPLGTMLGQRNLNIANFVKDFNEQTKTIKDGTPLVTLTQPQGDRSYILEILKPPVSFLLKQAAGIQRASMTPGRSVAGIVSVKHVYEIAKFKIDDIIHAHKSMEEMCIKVIDEANRAGIKVVNHDLDPEELREFLAQRQEVEKKELADLVEKKAAKMMRAAAAAAAPATPAKK